MKFDITKLPIDAAVMGFLMLALAVTFVLAFAWIDDGEGSEEPPTATESPDGGTPGPGGDEIAISMGDNFFDPDTTTVGAGATTTFALTNNGVAIHNMRIAGPDGEYDTGDDAVSDPEVVSGGETATLEWEAPAEAGEIDFRCDFHPTDMVGKITVQ